MSTIVDQLVQTLGDKNLILYDGDCIYCQKYVEFVRIREALGSCTLANLRDFPEIVEALRKEGIEPDSGMVFVTGGNIYHGSAALNYLARLSSRGGVANGLQRFLFSSSFIANLAYPFLKVGRSVTLLLRGKSRIR